MILGNISAINHAVAANLGISLVPLSSVKRHLESGMVRKIQVEEKVWKYPFYLVYYSDKKLSIPSKLLIDTIKDKIHNFV
jgi:DNA-binding transcriptional LysR family regulator